MYRTMWYDLSTLLLAAALQRLPVPSHTTCSMLHAQHTYPDMCMAHDM